MYLYFLDTPPKIYKDVLFSYITYCSKFDIQRTVHPDISL